MKLFANTASRHNQVYVCYYSLYILVQKSLKVVFCAFVSKLEEIKIYKRTFNLSNMILKLIDTKLNVSKYEKFVE